MQTRICNAVAELAALGAEVDAAAEILLTAAETALATVAASTSLAPAERAALEAQLQAMMAACAFQDLTGQRLTKVQAILYGDQTPGGELENGPALTGRGLDQAAADALFSKAG